ncbi:MAG: HdeD family acid-resistance protein [Thomasclavelia sp.]|uniref:HdeD family acid-resistance protein n=1 Tax=Thomasclavelia sp. TaxID=3025757 RepID=UPI0039A0CE26
MLRFSDGFDFRSEFTEKWNKKIHLLRVVGIIVSILMILCAILCIIYPIKSVTLIGDIAAVLIFILGIYQIVDYFAAPQLFRWPGSLVSAVCNLLIGLLLICSPIEITINTFAFIFGFILVVYGLNKLSFAHQLSYFGIQDYGWVIFTGIVNILAALAFIIAPMLLTVVLNYIVAAYLLVGGIVLLIEVIEMKDLRL